MYRSTVPGRTLAIALDTISEKLGIAMTDRQRIIVWRAFEDAVNEALEQIPKENVIAVECRRNRIAFSPDSPQQPLPAKSDEGGSSTQMEKDDGLKREHQNDDSHDERVCSYPMYRCIDGLWEIVLKDATIHLTGQQALLAGTTKIKVDTLKIEGREEGHTPDDEFDFTAPFTARSGREGKKRPR